MGEEGGRNGNREEGKGGEEGRGTGGEGRVWGFGVFRVRGDHFNFDSFNMKGSFRFQVSIFFPFLSFPTLNRSQNPSKNTNVFVITITIAKT